jgi:OPT family oligopeptide transporter
MILISVAACEFYNDQLQLRWWGVLLACGMALFFTLPIGVITAITNQTPGLNIITEYLIGYIYPGRPVANVCFKTYGYISMTQAVYFLSDFKLGHYMKIPPRAMFSAQLLGTVIAAVVNLGTAWWLLTTIPDICNSDVLPSGSPWTCPGDTVFFDASVIWGLIGPKRMFGSLGIYKAINWFFLIGALAPVPFWILHKTFPDKKWPLYVYTPILIGATGNMPPATAVNYIAWFLVGFIFNFVVFRFRKVWWQRYNYVLSAALDAGLAFMGVLLYFALQVEDKNISWWGSSVDRCPLASCPTRPGVFKDGCPAF